MTMIKKIVDDLSETENLKLTLASLRQEVSRMENHLDRVHHECYTVEQKLASCNQQLEIYNELENNGISLSDLIHFRHKVVEIVKAHMDNNRKIFTPKAAFMKFRNDVETQYDSKLGSEMRLQEDEASLKRVLQEYDTLMAKYSKRRDVMTRLRSLLSSEIATLWIVLIYFSKHFPAHKFLDFQPTNYYYTILYQ